MAKLNATRPLEYVCFFPIEIPTKEGDAYIYMALDVFSDFAIHAGTELSNNSSTMLKLIAQLMDHPDFKKLRGREFTLVLHRYEEISDDINAIIRPYKGKLLIDELFHAEHMIPFIETFFLTLKKSTQK